MTPIVAMLVALLLGEVMVRVAAPQALSGAWLTTDPGGYDLNRPDTRARHAFGDRAVYYSFNRHGLRGPEPSNAPFRVLVLGDSVTFGWLLEEPVTYVAQLRAAAVREWGEQRIEILNGAVGGWGMGEYAAFVEDHAAGLEPDAIVIFLSGDEPRRMAASGLWRLKDPSHAERVHREATVKRSLDFIDQLPGYQALIEHSHAAQLARRTVIGQLFRQPAAAPNRDSAPGTPAANADAIVALNHVLLRRVDAWARARGARLLVVSTGLVGLNTSDAGVAANRRALEEMPKLLADLRVPYLNLWPELRFILQQPDRYLIRDDGHPNENATREIADRTWPWLRDQLAGSLSSAQ